MTFLRAIPLLLACISLVCGCARVDLLNATIPTSGYTVINEIPYKYGARGKLDVYVPDHPAPGHPVVVFYYGGSWKEGDRSDYLFVGEAFASKGFTTVISDYRVYPDVYFPDFMEDSAAAFVWTHKHISEYGGNPENIFAVGHSAGAYNAVMLTLNPDYLRAAGGQTHWIRGTIGISGPYDFLPLVDPVLIDIFSRRDLSSTQPINFTGSRTPPMLLLTGDEDADVLPQNSINLASKLAATGNAVTEITYPGIGHIGIILSLADGFRGRAPVLEDCAIFINGISQQTKKNHKPSTRRSTQ